jgi:predicted nuclease of predicted toxin-antitoxin system
MAFLYANENFPYQVVQALRGLGHDVLTSLEAGNANQSIPDEQVLEFATQNRRALLTINKRDFIQLHKVNQSHAGIIVCSQDADIGGQAKRIHQEITSLSSLAGKPVRIHRPTR